MLVGCFGLRIILRWKEGHLFDQTSWWSKEAVRGKQEISIAVICNSGAVVAEV